MASHRELSLESEQGALGGDVRRALFLDRMATISFGHVRPDGYGGRHRMVAHGLGLATQGLSKRANDVSRKGDRFLPDAELSDAG